jgi:hypothetical protein
MQHTRQMRGEQTCSIGIAGQCMRMQGHATRCCTTRVVLPLHLTPTHATLMQRWSVQQHTDSTGWGAGDQSPHLLWRVMNGELGALLPKVIVILIGTNDLGMVAACRRYGLRLPHCKDPTKVGWACCTQAGGCPWPPHATAVMSLLCGAAHCIVHEFFFGSNFLKYHPLTAVIKY